MYQHRTALVLELNYADLIFIIRHLLAYMEDFDIWLPSGRGSFNQQTGLMEWKFNDYDPVDRRLAGKVLASIGREDEEFFYWQGPADLKINPERLYEMVRLWHLRQKGWRRIGRTQLLAAYEALYLKKNPAERALRPRRDPDQFTPLPSWEFS